MFTSYSVENDKEFKRNVEQVLAATGSLKIPFKLILNDFYKSEKSIFNLGSMGQYPPYSKSYEVWKTKKKGSPFPPLKLSGKLESSVTSPSSMGSIWDIKDTYMIVGTSIPYAVYHQSDDPRTKIPLRKFLFIGPEASRYATSDMMGRMNRWMGYLDEYYTKHLKRVGTINKDANWKM